MEDPDTKNFQIFVLKEIKQPTCMQLGFPSSNAITKHLFSFLRQLPRAKDTAALSGGGLKRLVKSVGDTMFQLTTKMSESDQVWFIMTHLLL